MEKYKTTNMLLLTTKPQTVKAKKLTGFDSYTKNYSITNQLNFFNRANKIATSGHMHNSPYAYTTMLY